MGRRRVVLPKDYQRPQHWWLTPLDPDDDAYESTIKLLIQGGRRIQQVSEDFGPDSPQARQALENWSRRIRLRRSNADALAS